MTIDLNPVPLAPPFPYKPHPLANAFPLMTPDAFREFVKDVADQGVQKPVIILDNQVLDGRNRYLAAREAGVSCPAVVYTGSDPAAFVVSMNLRRRHLDASQRAMAAAVVAKLAKGDNQHTQIRGTTQAEAADMLNVSVRSVQDAATVRERGVEELTDLVTGGEVAVSAAAEVARLPVEEQAAVVAAGAEAVTERAAAVRKERVADRWQDRVARLVAKAKAGGEIEPNKPDVRVSVAVHCLVTGKSPEAVEAVIRATGLCRAGFDQAVRVLTTDPEILAIEQEHSALILSSIMAADVEASSGYRLDEARSDAEALERVWRKGWVAAVLGKSLDRDADGDLYVAFHALADEQQEAFAAGHTAFLAEYAAFIDMVA